MNTSKKIILGIVILLPLLLISCLPEPEPYFQGELPSTPVNLAPFNTEYDDYNSTAPTLGSLIPFCFSTNRKTSGENFDIIYQPMTVSFSKISGELAIINGYSHWGVYQPTLDVINDAVDKANTVGNEFGPYLVFNPNRKTNSDEFLLLYATDITGKFQIGYTHNVDLNTFTEGAPLSAFASDYNDLYPSFNSDLSNGDILGIYFCSDREDDVFNIYFTPIDISDDNLIESLENLNDIEVAKVEALSSEYDDKCPYFFGDKMVFASNRPGGQGGYDLYYSTFEDGQWSAPVNFGPTINSPEDEFRPILIEEYVDVAKFMMIFSSNRPGGKGGYDLYFVGIDK